MIQWRMCARLSLQCELQLISTDEEVTSCHMKFSSYRSIVKNYSFRYRILKNYITLDAAESK